MREMAASLYAVVNKYLDWINLPRSISVADIVEIIIIAFVIYNILAWIKNTRAWALLRGLIVILIFLALMAIFQLNVILWLAARLANVAVIALVIIFQPELRNALESLGKRNFLGKLFDFDFSRDSSMRFSERTISEIAKASYEMGKAKTGALIVLERRERLNEYIRTGINLDSLISSQLLINIFEHNTPLHDGAVIVREDRIVSATCYLPLSDNLDLSKDLGTRHRAALGISEASDSVTVVVSEETGSVSLAIEGTLYR
ncbi:MAG: diadenylate cyclase CdaA, partial [Clostridiales bacterium]|nr:diadenylate cyclase CdaA [Clostridiales bacterium]